jgi:hypothetical protein
MMHCTAVVRFVACGAAMTPLHTVAAPQQVCHSLALVASLCRNTASAVQHHCLGQNTRRIPRPSHQLINIAMRCSHRSESAAQAPVRALLLPARREHEADISAC